jgi:hypothetical protein
MPKCAVGHALLACLPVRSTITTNYDTLFEKASHNVNAFGGRPYARDKMAVLPYAPKKDCQRWLLKMHGGVTKPDSIVLTAEDYQKYENSTAAALGGLVQAELMTSHMMFVGFSMTDANFERLIDSVVAAYGGEKRDGAGTIVNLGAAPAWMVEKFAKYGIKTESIAADVKWNPYDASNRHNTNPSREIEIWYDYMAMRATDTAYPIFNKNFDTALKREDIELRDHLSLMLENAPREAMAAHAWEKVAGAASCLCLWAVSSLNATTFLTSRSSLSYSVALRNLHRSWLEGVP